MNASMPAPKQSQPPATSSELQPDSSSEKKLLKVQPVTAPGSGCEPPSLQSTAEVMSGCESPSLQSKTAEAMSGFESPSLQSRTAEVTSGCESPSLQSRTAEAMSGCESPSLQSGKAEAMDASTQDSSPAQRIRELDQLYNKHKETGPPSPNDAYVLIRMAQLLIEKQADGEAMEILKQLAHDPQYDDQELLANICNAISTIEIHNRLHNKALSAEARALRDKALSHPYIQKHLSRAT